mmetsp:Transcript_10370/g.17407  ORF Transcript_10370/g.17407 Transcript_10370/m.17407 type:complete len:377 (+) Transcript_10370:3-1133(+)
MFALGNGSQESLVTPIMHRLRESLVQRGADGIRGLARHFKICDKQAPFGKLDAHEFARCCSLNRLDLNDREIAVLMSHFDRDGNGVISYEEFLRSLRGRLSHPRKQMALRVFHALDAQSAGGEHGYLTVRTIDPIYSTSRHPAVVAGKMTRKQVLKEFLDAFEGPEGNRDGRVTLEEWLRYYEEVSSSIDTDDHFIELLQTTWARVLKLQPLPSQSEVNRLEESIKKSVYSRVTHGTVSSARREVAKAFQLFDRDDKHGVSLDEFCHALERFGVHVTGRGHGSAPGGMPLATVKALFNRYDVDGSGSISYAEFCSRLFEADARTFEPPSRPHSQRPPSKPCFEPNRRHKDSKLHGLVPGPAARPSSAHAHVPLRQQ